MSVMGCFRPRGVIHAPECPSLICWGAGVAELPGAGRSFRDGVTVIAAPQADAVLAALVEDAVVLDPFTVDCVTERLAASVAERERAGCRCPVRPRALPITVAPRRRNPSRSLRAA